MSENLAVRYHSFGDPLDVLKLEKLSMPVPENGQVLVKLLLSTINPSDTGMILGKYGKLQELPAVAGREGVAEVVSTGPGVDPSLVGKRVKMPEANGVWQTYALANVKDLWEIPLDVPLEMAAMAFINPPTSWRLLRDANLKRGQWIVQNAANSAVGLFVIQMAKHMGLKTINLVRREELIPELKAAGGDLVLMDNDDYPAEVKKELGRDEVMLGLNSIGGESAMRMLKVLSNDAEHITFGAMDFSAIRFPTRFLIFNNISFKGFWMDRWFKQNTYERREIMYSKLWTLMKEGTIHAPIEKIYSLDNVHEAMKHAAQARNGKVLLKPV